MQRLVFAVLVLVGIGLALAVFIGFHDPEPIHDAESAAPDQTDFLASSRVSVRDEALSDQIIPTGMINRPKSTNNHQRVQVAHGFAQNGNIRSEAAFDGFVDKWVKPSKTAIPIEFVDAFTKSFKNLPKERQYVCLQRALNLIPDENIMLVMGILMDCDTDKTMAEAIFHDILNRNDSIKLTIIDEICANKEHPCWGEANWISKALGERRGKD